MPQRGRKRPGIGEDREVRIVGGAPPRLEAPAPDLQREPIVTQPEVDDPANPAGRNSVFKAMTNASGPSSASPPGNGARLPHAPSPMTSGSSSCPHAVSS